MSRRSHREPDAGSGCASQPIGTSVPFPSPTMIRPLLFVLVPCSLAIAQHTQPGPSVIRRVPQDFGTIQQAIDISNNGDTVLVTMSQDYFESPNVDKDIKVTAKANSGPGVLRGRFVLNGVGAGMQLRGFTITNPSVPQDGGGILVVGGFPVIRECTITGCTALEFGGGIAVFSGGPDVKNCKITDNHARGGGGIYVLHSANMLVLNSLVKDNTAIDEVSSNGGGIHVDAGDLWVRNCTIVGNVLDNQVPHGGGMYCTGIDGALTVALDNSIVWGNVTGPFSTQVQVDAFCTFTVGHSDIMGGQLAGFSVSFLGTLNFGAGNISLDPQFNADGYHIPNFSPCINTGLTSLMTPGEVDIDLQSRLFSTNIDMGCDEFVIAP